MRIVVAQRDLKGDAQIKARSMMNRTLAQKARKQLLRRGRTLLKGPGSEESLTELEEIHAALERVERGSFGRCDKCYQGIELDRLETKPQIRFCTDCDPSEAVAVAPAPAPTAA